MEQDQDQQQAEQPVQPEQPAAMPVHEFDRDTGEHIGQGFAYRDQMEPGRWIMPPNATQDEPPKPAEGEGVKRQGGAWAIFKRPAPAVPAPEPAIDPKVKRRAEINMRLDMIDRKSTRSVRESLIAQAAGKPVPAFAVKKLGDLEAEAALLRAELVGLA